MILGSGAELSNEQDNYTINQPLTGTNMLRMEPGPLGEPWRLRRPVSEILKPIAFILEVDEE